MKKFIALLALAAMLTACSDRGNSPAETTTEVTTVTTTEVATTTSATETEAETTAAIEECKCEHEWQHVFSEYINGLDFYYGLYVKDFNNDSIPEVVVARDSCEWTEVLVYNDGEIKSYEYVTAGSYGYVRYIRDTNQILHCPLYGHTATTQGMETIFIYDWVDNGFVETFSMERDAAYYEPDILEYTQGYINGEEVDFDTFEAKLAEMKQLVEENEYFPCIYKDDENYAEYVAENLPCVKMEE
ncbi:MAG: hypothetical protein IJC04_02435 [Oscillospiraceae bacterium]|nr:hypothetical protein [Oscillospiraceae bacterium]